MILHIPHFSRTIPENLRDQIVLSDEDLSTELTLMTDAFTDELFAFPETAIVRFPISRLLVDVERFLDDAEEPMSRMGMGAIYTRTAFMATLRRPLESHEVRTLVSEYYEPHHRRLLGEVNNELEKYGKALIVDCHSFPSQPLLCDLDQSVPRSDFCIGTDPFHTPKELIEIVERSIKGSGYSVGIDRPYSGSLVPMDFYRKDHRVSSLMIEVNRSLYMNEVTGEKNTRFDVIKGVILTLMAVIDEFWKDALANVPGHEGTTAACAILEEVPMTALRSRYEGCLLGLAAGDALGTTVEFKPPGSFSPLTDIVGGGPFDLKKGQWTDDTSMALCLAESLVQCRGFDAHDQMKRYTRWSKEGYLSSNGRCFDIGITVSQALRKFERTGDPFAGSTDPHSAGNGSLMRLAPVPLFFAADPEKAIQMSAESSRTTHGAVTCLDACRYFAGLIVGAINGLSKRELLSLRFTPVEGLWDRNPLCEEINEIARGSFFSKNPPEIVGSGYVVKSLEAALWAFRRSSDFRDGCLLAVNLGNDADTTGAIYGQLAGAYYGVEGIPSEWRDCLAQKDLIGQLAVELLQGRS